MDNDALEEQEGSEGLGQSDLAASYVAYARRAIRKRRPMAIVTFVVGVLLTVAALVVLPKTYHSEAKLMVQGNPVLENDSRAWNALGNASSVILRRDNLVAIAQQTDLVRQWEATRPAVLKLKDRLVGVGKLSDTDMMDALTGNLLTRLSVDGKEGVLTIGVDWPEPKVAARIVDTALQTFLEARHIAEISSIEERISILNGHARREREEIDALAAQLQRVREDKLQQASKLQASQTSTPAATAAPAVPRHFAMPAVTAVDERLPQLRELAEAKKRQIADMEGDRNRRLLEAQARLADLKMKFTDQHPEVLSMEQSVLTLSKESPSVKALKGEVKELESDIASRSAAPRPSALGGGIPSAAGAPAAPAAEPLPNEIVSLLNSGEGVDPAINAQLGSAVSKYTALRDQITMWQVELDTAQAAFRHRYKVVAPAEVARKPSKPKVPAVLGGGLIGALLLALLLPILAELRTGVIVERWQVQQLKLPILAELRMPPAE